jgi:uncharacterized membrane protein (UPF0182 family)
MAPQYQVYAPPGSNTQEFTISDGFVPASTSSAANSSQNLNLRAFMVGGSDPSDYGHLTVYETPAGTYGPANADLEISSNQAVSKDISLLDTNGSVVLLGETLMVPVGNSMVYLRPMYVAATTKPQPQLQYVVAVLGKNVAIEPTLNAVLYDVLHTNITTPPGSGGTPVTGTVPTAVAQDLQQAQTDYNNAKAALAAGDLGQYQALIQAMQQAIAAAQAVLGTPSPSTTTTTTKPPKGKSPRTGSTSSTASTTTSVPTSTEPQGSSTTTTNGIASAAGH